MKDEIKEIIDRLERIDHKEYIAFEFADIATFDEVARCFEERKKMANCIINLQEENMKLISENEAIKNIKYTVDEIIYKSRNEKANWWLKEMLKQAKSDETKAIINGTLDLLLQGSDKDE